MPPFLDTDFCFYLRFNLIITTLKIALPRRLKKDKGGIEESIRERYQS